MFARHKCVYVANGCREPYRSNEPTSERRGDRRARSDDELLHHLHCLRQLLFRTQWPRLFSTLYHPFVFILLNCKRFCSAAKEWRTFLSDCRLLIVWPLHKVRHCTLSLSRLFRLSCSFCLFPTNLSIALLLMLLIFLHVYDFSLYRIFSTLHQTLRR